MASKVVIQNAILRGSSQEQFLQRVATVYLEGGEEYRVWAPSEATGDALEWLKYSSVHQPSKDGRGESVVTDWHCGFVIEQVAEELGRRKLDADIWKWGEHPDARYYAAQVCLRGYVQSSHGADFEREQHCQQCGEACIDGCKHCKAPIRGSGIYESPLDYKRPSFCYKCGRPYLWMEDRLQTAKELLNHDDKLSLEEREKLWGLLQYVMSDLKSDMVPAKKKLFEIGIGKALPATREFFLDFMTKYLAEMSKP